MGTKDLDMDPYQSYFQTHGSQMKLSVFSLLYRDFRYRPVPNY